MTIKILGAGLSGMSAAINLAQNGKDVEIFELRKDVGMQIGTNFQGIGCSSDKFDAYLKNLNIDSDQLSFAKNECNKMFAITRKHQKLLKLNEPYCLVCRGGKESLEYSLYKLAKSLGVKFRFDSRVNEKEVDIIASGTKKAHGAAFGCVYNEFDFDMDTMTIMFDDRYSPKGYYFYVLPHLNGAIEAVNCTSAPHTDKVKTLYFKAIEERKEIRDIIKGKEVQTFSGIGSAEYTKTKKIDNRLYVGESAGFQDVFMGFGMKFALESGKLAADSIITGKDYDYLWKKHLLDNFKFRIAERFITSTLGDRPIQWYIGRRNDTIDLDNAIPNNAFTKVLKEVFFRLGVTKYKIKGYW